MVWGKDWTIWPFHLPLEQVTKADSGATVIAAIVTVVAALVALRTYQHSARTARLSHMHRLFGDYLKMRVDISLRDEVGDESQEKSGLTSSVFLSVKLYTLEEMWLWLKREYPFAEWGWGSEHKEGWKATIRMHLRHQWRDTRESLRKNYKAYTPDFRAYCWSVFEDVRRSEKKRRRQFRRSKGTGQITPAP